jgi:16S rRNA (guanine966-N2)-methyltransferase
VRVIAGTAKGARLATVPGGTRPLSDRAREGLFSSLGSEVAGAQVLDLFCGTGAVGIEALSRGADHATLVDIAPAAIAAVRDNLRRTGLHERATVSRADARRLDPRSLTRPTSVTPAGFDLVFLDPPYAIAPADLDAALALAGTVALPSGLVVLTRQAKGYMPVIPIDWAPDRRLSYGDALILAFRIPGRSP